MKSKHNFPPAKWTIILFISAENDLMEHMKIVYNQLAKVGSTRGEINFVVLFDGLKLPDKKNLKTKIGCPTVYYVTRYNNYPDGEIVDCYKQRREDDLTNEKNLPRMLRRIKDKFPADHF